MVDLGDDASSILPTIQRESISLLMIDGEYRLYILDMSSLVSDFFQSFASIATFLGKMTLVSST